LPTITYFEDVMMRLCKQFNFALGIYLALFSILAHADFQSRLEEKYPITKGSKIEKAFPGFWAVVKNGEVLYFNDDITVLIKGEVVDLIKKQSMTKKLIEDNQPKLDLSLLSTKDAIKLGNGARKIYVFSDPDCTYCKQLERELNQLKNTEVFIFQMPLDRHPNARAVAESIWCQADQEKGWRDYMDAGVVPKAAKCDNPIERNLALAAKFGISGTPAIIFEDGSIIPGAVPVKTINDKLDAAK
jgi:thiol:disulfide interchange protein DsbC